VPLRQVLVEATRRVVDGGEYVELATYYRSRLTVQDPTVLAMIQWAAARGTGLTLTKNGGTFAGMQSTVVVDPLKPKEIDEFKAAFQPAKVIAIPYL
jgi:hypothetical protein